MASQPGRRWKPSATFLLRGGLLSLLLGALIGLLIALGADRLEPFLLLLTGLLGLLVFLSSCTMLAATAHLIAPMSAPVKVLSLTALFFAAGVISWFGVYGLFLVVKAKPLRISLPDVALPVAITGLVAVVVGFGFYAYDALRQRLLQSVSRLKEAEFAERELDVARSIHRRLLPPTEIDGEGYRIAARNVPARFVAGDFYDIFSLRDGTMGIAVADVAGKGMGASLIMASVKAMLPLVAAERTVEETLQALNRKLVADLGRREFVAVCFASFDPRTGNLRLANAGLPDPYLLRPGEPPTTLSVPGHRLPLGLRRDQAYRSIRAKLHPGDRLLLVTDGLPEALTLEGEPLGYEAFGALLTARELAPALWLDELLGQVQRETRAELEDDWTALLLERPTGVAKVWFSRTT